jgi:hypothetical protein
MTAHLSVPLYSTKSSRSILSSFDPSLGHQQEDVFSAMIDDSNGMNHNLIIQYIKMMVDHHHQKQMITKNRQT